MDYNAILGSIVAELSENAKKVSTEEIEKFADLVIAAKRVFVAGAGRSGFAARAFSNRTMHLGKIVYFVGEPTTPSIGEGDLMICACGSANVGHENYVADQAKKAGAKLALITPAGAGFLLDIADIKVRVPAAAYKAAGDFVPTQQLMGNLFEQTLFIFYDILVMMLREEMVARHRNVE